MKLILGFFFLGLLVGDMAGLTSESIVSKLIALFFALFGGSFVLLYQKFNPEERGQVGLLIASISLGTIFGIHAGILTTEFRLLSPKPTPIIQTTVQQPIKLSVVPVQQVPPPKPAQIASNEPRKKTDKAEPKCPEVPEHYMYLRKKVIPGAALIDSQLQADVITPAEAYRQLHALIEDDKR